MRAHVLIPHELNKGGLTLTHIMGLLEQFEADTGLHFSDKTLLQRALTHRSVVNEVPEFPLSDNERLEFLGDAVLDFLVAEFLYHRFPEQREGPLTSMRAALVRRDTLARFAQQMNLGRYLLMGRGEEESGGRRRPATLCAAFEALVGAIYLDQGLEAVEAFIRPLIEPELDHVLQEALDKDAKSRLQEWSQAYLQATPTYKTVGERGPDHAKEFTVQVIIKGVVYGEGTGHSKQLAAQAAAKAALELLTRLYAEGKLPGVAEG
ncbi:MAG: ribonuclease III [Anaerolineae bacterium]|nr:ribonuclease III [Anaerolineae bacterium]MDW8100443.1 ribonuclease III [Anaerolineae bacterium]